MIHLRDGEQRFNQVRILEFRTDASTLDMKERTVSGWASTPEVDSYEEVILPAAYTESLPAYLRNPVVYWNHEYRNVPIGKIIAAEVRTAGLWVTVQFGTTPLAQEVWTAVAIDGTVRSMSVGFWGDYTPEYGYFDKDRGIWIWTYVELIEVSVCGLPANAGSQFQLSRSMGLLSTRVYRVVREKPQEDVTFDRDDLNLRLLTWAGDDETRLSEVFVWERKLPVADLVGDEPQISWPVVADSMATLLGAKGGVAEMPVAAKRQAFRILAQCYARFSKQVPTWKGQWPSSLREVTFHSDELGLVEIVVAQANAKAVLGGSQALANIQRHWVKQPNGGPSASLAEPAVRSIRQLCGVLEALPELPSELAQGVEEIARTLQGLKTAGRTVRISTPTIRITRGK